MPLRPWPAITAASSCLMRATRAEFTGVGTPQWSPSATTAPFRKLNRSRRSVFSFPHFRQRFDARATMRKIRGLAFVERTADEPLPERRKEIRTAEDFVTLPRPTLLHRGMHRAAVAYQTIPLCVLWMDPNHHVNTMGQNASPDEDAWDVTPPLFCQAKPVFFVIACGHIRFKL